MNLLPEAPEYLNDEAKAYFETIGKILVCSGRYLDGDLKPLSRLCHLYTMADALEKEMNEAWSGSLFKSSFSCYDKLLKNILSLETAFQLNPGSRARAKLSVSKKVKVFDLSVNSRTK